MINKSLQVPKSILDYCVARDSAIRRIEQSYTLLDNVESDLNKLTSHLFPYEARPKYEISYIVKDLDRRFWEKAFEKTGFIHLMDTEAKKKYEKEVSENPPAFTEDNIQETFLSLAQKADKMFKRGLVNVFRSFSKKHKTNTTEPFKVTEKAIMNGMVIINFKNNLQINHVYRHASTRLNDIDRVFKVLDEQIHVPYRLETAINHALQNDEHYEDDYYRIKCFRKGTMHIQFKRADLLDKANQLIHEYYEGKALAA